MSPSAGARHMGRHARRGTRVGKYPQPPLPEVIGEALTRAPVCRPEEHVVVEVARCGSAAGAPDQEVRRGPSASAGSMSTSVNGLELTMCSATSSRVENFFARALSQWRPTRF
ncbi:hypothetical protein EVAR_100632_1 [Eumeta japonica]|uniref:Uncharacterized protein n=1 Tax=Eumeta variegata TaxID=151549 RepID=A0A4C2A6T8_EUMVA|nr:hypothetical protein EVAR_100632_1 [Eumeta japonica]